MSCPTAHVRRWWIALLLIAVSLVLAVLAVLFVRGRAAVDELGDQIVQLQRAGESSETLYEWAGESARELAAALPGLVLPAEAHDLMLARQGESRPFYWLRFTLPASSQDAFVASTCVGSLAEGERPDFAYGHSPGVIANLPWWQPEGLERSAGGTCVANAVRYRLLADTAHEEDATVYLEIEPERS